MIKFQPNGAQFTLTNDQLSTVYRLSGGKDVEVVDHGHTTRITAYIDDLRYEIDEDGTVDCVERGVEEDGDWEWDSIGIPEPELGQVFEDGTVTVRIIGEPGKTMGHEGTDGVKLQEFYVAALVELADRISVGRYDDMWDDKIADDAGDTPDLYCNVSFGGELSRCVNCGQPGHLTVAGYCKECKGVYA